MQFSYFFIHYTNINMLYFDSMYVGRCDNILTSFKYLRRSIHLIKNFTRIKSVADFIVQNFLYSTCIRHSA